MDTNYPKQQQQKSKRNSKIKNSYNVKRNNYSNESGRARSVSDCCVISRIYRILCVWNGYVTIDDDSKYF